MRLWAISTGEHAPRGRFDGAVHSVFRRACNVRLDDGSLLALLGPELANLPHGIRIETAPGFAFEHHLRVGQKVGCRADILRLGEAGLAIDLSRACTWRSDLAGAGTGLDRPGAARAWHTAWRELRRHERALATADPAGGLRQQRAPSPCAALRRVALREGLQLARTTRSMRADQAGATIGRLIGCGPGLTPAGDDLIGGFLAGLWASAGARAERLAFVRSLGATVVRAAAATNEISRAFLRHAAAGSVAEPLTLLARRIVEGAAPVEVERAAAHALRFGHTSGADATQGLLLGLAAWRRPWPFSEEAARIEAPR